MASSEGISSSCCLYGHIETSWELPRKYPMSHQAARSKKTHRISHQNSPFSCRTLDEKYRCDRRLATGFSPRVPHKSEFHSIQTLWMRQSFLRQSFHRGNRQSTIVNGDAKLGRVLAVVRVRPVLCVNSHVKSGLSLATSRSLTCWPQMKTCKYNECRCGQSEHTDTQSPFDHRSRFAKD